MIYAKQILNLTKMKADEKELLGKGDVYVRRRPCAAFLALYMYCARLYESANVVVVSGQHCDLSEREQFVDKIGSAGRSGPSEVSRLSAESIDSLA